MKLNSNGQSRAMFIVGDDNNPLQIPIEGDLESFELSDAQIKSLTERGADAARIQLGATEAEQIDAEIVAVLAGGAGSLNGTSSEVVRYVCRRLDNPNVTISTVIAVPEGERVPEEGDTVTINRYPAPGLYYNRAGRSTNRAETLMYCTVPGLTPAKLSRVRETTLEQLQKQTALAERDAARKRAAAGTKATTEA